MNLRSGALGLALVAAFAACALLAPAAQAEETLLFRAEVTPVNENGTQSETQTIGFEAGTFKCVAANLKDKEGNGGMMLIMEPTYSECTLGGNAATVKMNGCTYTFEPLSTLAADKFSGRMGVVCSTGKIEISITGCTVSIPGQINLETVEFVNNTGASPAKDETWRTEIKTAEYTQSGLGCKNGTFKNGTFAGKETIQGTSSTSGLPDGLWIA